MLYENPKLEDVYKTNGVPTYTFVEPSRFTDILLSLRTPGRCLVVEGPSGIGKSTAIEIAIEKIGISKSVTKLSARKSEDVEYIKMLPTTDHVGTVLVDDFHKLDDATKSSLADYLKLLADKEDKYTKIIILGINRAGDSLIQFSPDLVNRIDIVRFETEPDSKIFELVQNGEKTLNISLGVSQDIVQASAGSFYLAQMLSKETCLAARVLEKSLNPQTLNISFELVKANVWDRLALSFHKRSVDFCVGTRLRKEGRAPYLHILNWLATGHTWTLDLRDAIRRYRDLSGSVSQVVDKGFLRDLINHNSDIRQVLHYDEASELLTVEDPQFLFYIRNIPWHQFARQLGFLTVEFDRRYDFALSFAGTDRDIAEQIFGNLTENEVEVFYDKNEQHRILATDVEEYLRPIYQTEAQFVIVLLGSDYPKRIWTQIESDAFKERFKDGSVIPIWFANAPISAFDSTRRIGGITFDRGKNITQQLETITRDLLRKLSETRKPVGTP
ncbi:MAG: TIR domain-containing protein [Bacteroidota bacterium]|nr:TIR domain-containing protein [Bacteroidota bacterium]